MAFIHEIKPKIKNSNPIIRIEIKESRLVRELTSTVADIVLLATFIYAIILVERNAGEDL